MRFATNTSLICDACGNRGPAATSEHEAVGRAEALGWLLRRGHDTVLCTDCRPPAGLTPPQRVNFRRALDELTSR